MPPQPPSRSNCTADTASARVVRVAESPPNRTSRRHSRLSVNRFNGYRSQRHCSHFKRAGAASDDRGQRTRSQNSKARPSAAIRAWLLRPAYGVQRVYHHDAFVLGNVPEFPCELRKLSRSYISGGHLASLTHLGSEPAGRLARPTADVRHPHARQHAEGSHHVAARGAADTVDESQPGGGNLSGCERISRRGG